MKNILLTTLLLMSIYCDKDQSDKIKVSEIGENNQQTSQCSPDMLIGDWSSNYQNPYALRVKRNTQGFLKKVISGAGHGTGFNPVRIECDSSCICKLWGGKNLDHLSWEIKVKGDYFLVLYSSNFKDEDMNIKNEIFAKNRVPEEEEIEKVRKELFSESPRSDNL